MTKNGQAAFSSNHASWHLTVLTIGSMMASSVAFAQEEVTTEVAEPSGPTVEEAVAFVNQQLSASASMAAPCRESTVLAVEDDGRVSFEVSRENHCEHSRLTAHLLDLDPGSIDVATDDAVVIRMGCVDGVECGRYWERRKYLVGEEWTLRDDDWRPQSEYAERTHKLTGLEIVLSSDERYAQRVVEGIQYLLVAARADPSYAPPVPYGTPEEEVAESDLP